MGLGEGKEGNFPPFQRVRNASKGLSWTQGQSNLVIVVVKSCGEQRCGAEFGQERPLCFPCLQRGENGQQSCKGGSARCRSCAMALLLKTGSRSRVRWDRILLKGVKATSLLGLRGRNHSPAKSSWLKIPPPVKSEVGRVSQKEEESPPLPDTLNASKKIPGNRIFSGYIKIWFELSSFQGEQDTQPSPKRASTMSSQSHCSKRGVCCQKP